MALGIIGMNVLGTCIASVAAQKGAEVLCTDLDEEIVKGLEEGELPGYERGLQELFNVHVKKGLITITTNYRKSIEGISFNSDLRDHRERSNVTGFKTGGKGYSPYRTLLKKRYGRHLNRYFAAGHSRENGNITQYLFRRKRSKGKRLCRLRTSKPALWETTRYLDVYPSLYSRV